MARLVKRRVDYGPDVIAKLFKGTRKREGRGGAKIMGYDLDCFRFEGDGVTSQMFASLYGMYPRFMDTPFNLDEIGNSTLSNWKKIKAQIKASWPKDAELAESLTDYSEDWRAWSNGTGAMPMPTDILRPNNILISFPGEIDSVWSTDYRLFDGRGNLVQVGDGERVFMWMDKDGERFVSDFPGNPFSGSSSATLAPESSAPAVSPKAKAHGYLKFSVYGIGRDYGVVQFTTRSIYEILFIDRYLEWATQEYGSLVRTRDGEAIPFLFYRGLQKIMAPDESGKRVVRDKSLVKLCVHPQWYEQYESKKRRQLGITDIPAGLLTVRDVDVNTGEIIMSDDMIVSFDFDDPESDIIDGSDEAEYREAEAHDALDEDVDFGQGQSSTGEEGDAPAVDIDYVNSAVFPSLGPRWVGKADEIFAVFTQEGFLVSVAAEQKKWIAYINGRGEMPSPAASATPQDLADDSKIPI